MIAEIRFTEKQAKKELLLYYLMIRNLEAVRLTESLHMRMNQRKEFQT